MPYQSTTNLFQNTKYVVDINGGTPYTTIQSAINAAQAAGVDATVFVRPGAYTENLTLYDDIYLEGEGSQTTSITGTHTPPNSGDVYIKGFTLISATNILSSAAAGTTRIFFEWCNFQITSGYSASLPNWTGVIYFNNCQDSSTDNGIVNNTGTAPVQLLNSTIGQGVANTCVISGILESVNTVIFCPIQIGGAATSLIKSTALFGAVTIQDTAAVQFYDSELGSTLTHNSADTVTLAGVTFVSAAATVIAGTGTVVFAGVNFGNSHGIAGTITQVLTPVTKTGEIHAENVQNMIMTGFLSWAASGPYFDDTTLGTFNLLVGGTGYIKSKLVSWAPQTINTLTQGSTWYIYIDATGTIGATSTRTNALFENNIVLFECLYDSTPVTAYQHTVKENHPYSYETTVSNYEHAVINTVIENITNGANIALVGPANVKVAISGTDTLADHGLYTTISDSAGVGVTWNKFYTTAGGKWALQNSSDTFAGYYNNAGTPTLLPANKYGVYRLYASKDNLNTTTPTYYAILDTAYYNNSAAATTAISNNSPAAITAELAMLELVQLGFIVFDQAAGQISSVTIAKTTLRSTISSGGSSIASSVSTDTSSFNGILSVADTNVQLALDTIDNWGASTTDHAVLIGNGTGSAIGSLAVGATGETLMGSTGADPGWTSSPSFGGSVTAGTTLTASSGNITLTSGNLVFTAVGKIYEGGTAGANVWSHKTGTRSTFLGEGAGYSVGSTAFITSTDTTAVGYNAFANANAGIGAGNTMLGSYAGALGYDANFQYNTAVGSYSMSNEGTSQYCTGVGAYTLRSVTGAYNTALGYYAGYSAGAGNSSIWINNDGANESNTLRIGAATGTGTRELNKAYICGIYNTAVGATAGVVLADSVNQLGGLAGSAGQVLQGGTKPSFSTATYPVTVNKGDVLVASADNVIGIVAGATTSGYVLTANGAGTAPTFQAPGGGGGLTWSVITADQTAVVDNGYICNKAGLLTLTLPASSAVGKVIRVSGMNTATGWKIAQNANQIIHFNSTDTTTGASGYLASSAIRDAVEIVCCVANLEWNVVSSVGNITIA